MQPDVRDLDLGTISAEAANQIGGAHFYAGQFALAERCFLRAVEAKPDYADAWGNLGLVWQTTGFMQDASGCYSKSFELKPDNPNNLANMGFLHGEEGHEEHAIRLYERALEIQPDHPRATANLSLALLKRFDFERGWKLMESRFRVLPPTSIMRGYDWMKWWDGGEVKRLAVWPEQGLGDQILYCTMIPELIGRGIPSVWEVDPRLVSALQRSFPTGVEFVPKGHDGTPFRECDAHIAMASIPQFYRKSEADFAAQPSRLIVPDPARHPGWLPRSDRKRIAISWRSFKPAQEMFVQRKKSAPLEAFAGLMARHDADLVDVQYGDVAQERRENDFLGRTPPIDLKNDIEGLLAVIDVCDAVITTSNVTAHFAGALGKPCYLIYLRDSPPFFYWARNDKGRSLWYKSVRIVSAPDMTDWGDAVAAAATMLE